MLSLRDSLSARRWSAVGALLAIAALINTSLVVLVVPFGIYALWKNRTRVLIPALCGALTCLAVISPWVLRNRIEFGKFMLRSNFPLEFRVGNNELSHGQKVERLHPSNTPSLNRHWQEVGESRFMAEDSNADAQYAASHFSKFAFDTSNRLVNYWTGAWIMSTADSPNSWPIIIATSTFTLIGFLGVGRMFSIDKSAAFMFSGCLLIYPIVYYVTTSQPRFYHSITPLLMLSGAYWVLDRKNRIAEAKTLEGRSLAESAADDVARTT
jgi:hypothetical protein